MKRNTGKPVAARNAIGNGNLLLSLRMTGKVPQGLILISFVGKLSPGNFTLFASPGRRYDWRLIKDMRVCAVIDDGIGSSSDLRAIAEQARVGECSAWHAGRKVGAWIYPDDEPVGNRIVHHPRVRSITWMQFQNDSFARAFETALEEDHETDPRRLRSGEVSAAEQGRLQAQFTGPDGGLGGGHVLRGEGGSW